MVLSKILCNRLKSLRIQNGYTVKKLNYLLSECCFPICIQTIYKWENGKAMPDLKALNVLATIYNVNIDSFFEDNSKIQSLNNDESRLLSFYRNKKAFRRIVFLLTKISYGGSNNGN